MQALLHITEYSQRKMMLYVRTIRHWQILCCRFSFSVHESAAIASEVTWALSDRCATSFFAPLFFHKTVFSGYLT